MTPSELTAARREDTIAELHQLEGYLAWIKDAPMHPVKKGRKAARTKRRIAELRRELGA